MELMDLTGSQLMFTDRSYAEYFTGKFFAEFWMNINNYEYAFMQTVASYFITRVLTTTDRGVIIVLDQDNLKLWFGISTIGFELTKKTVTFTNYTVLYFMDSFYQSKSESFPPVQGETLLSFDHKEQLRTDAYGIILACIDSGLQFLLIMLAKLRMSLFVKNDFEDVFLASMIASNDIREFQDSCIPLLLCKVAVSGSPQYGEILQDLYQTPDQNNPLLYEIILLSLHQPIETAIMKNDLDMVMYVSNKICRPCELLFIACLTVENQMRPAENDVRIMIMDTVLDRSDNISQILSTKDLCNLFSWKINVSILTKYARNKG